MVWSLVQVFINLLSNAIKFAPIGTIVEISITESDNSIEIAISDQGCGIPIANQEMIFEKFGQARVQDAAQGTGLGLAICKLIVDSHGGNIKVVSSEGEGATFIVHSGCIMGAAESRIASHYSVIDIGRASTSVDGCLSSKHNGTI